MITLTQLRRAVRCTDLRAGTWLRPLNSAMEKWEINTPTRVAAFLAQIAVESGSLRSVEENLNYGADGLANTWPSRYALDPKARPRVPNDLALKLHRKPELIANHTYANRMGNGGPESGDGWLYRGRGPKQITGRDNYTAYFKQNQSAVEPDLLLLPEYGADAAGWYWWRAGCSAMIDRGDFKAVSIAINGGLIGYEDGNTQGVDDRVEFYANSRLALGLA